MAAAWTIEPAPPVAGADTIVRVTLQSGDRTPVAGAALRLEAHMTHPGMATVTADLIGRGNGTYEARLRLSMPGDWTFVATGTLSDGSRITKEIQVPAVQPARTPEPTR